MFIAATKNGPAKGSARQKASSPNFVTNSRRVEIYLRSAFREFFCFHGPTCSMAPVGTRVLQLNIIDRALTESIDY